MNSIRLETSNLLNVDNTNFIGCVTTENGGAIFQNCAGSRLLVKHCFFIACRANTYAGGVCVYLSDESSISYSCFLNNEAKNAPSFAYFANVYDMKIGEIKYVSDISKSSVHGPVTGGRTSSVISFLNESNFIPTGDHYLFCVTSADNSPTNINYLILHNNTNNGAIFGIYYTSITISNSQIISCKAASISSFYHTSNVKSVMRNCIIKECSINSNGENEIYDCQIDKSFSGYDGPTTNTAFKLLNINLCVSSKKCTKRYTRVNTTNYLLMMIIMVNK